MKFRKITAIISPYRLESVEDVLLKSKVSGASISKVKGYGEYANFFNPDWLAEHVKVEVFIDSHRATETAEAIMDVAHSGSKGDGIVAIQPVESLYRIRTKEKMGHDDSV